MANNIPVLFDICLSCPVSMCSSYYLHRFKGKGLKMYCVIIHVNKCLPNLMFLLHLLFVKKIDINV